MRYPLIILSVVFILTLTGCVFLQGLDPSSYGQRNPQQETPKKGISLQQFGSVFDQDISVRENFPYSYGVLVRNYDEENDLDVTIKLTDNIDDRYGGIPEGHAGISLHELQIPAGREAVIGPLDFQYTDIENLGTKAVYQATATYEFILETGDSIQIPTLAQHCGTTADNPARRNLCNVRVQIDRGNNNIAPIRIENMAINFIPNNGNVQSTISFRMVNQGGGSIPQPQLNPINLQVSIDGFGPFRCTPYPVIIRESITTIQCTAEGSFPSGSTEPQLLYITAAYPYQIVTGIQGIPIEQEEEPLL